MGFYGKAVSPGTHSSPKAQLIPGETTRLVPGNQRFPSFLLPSPKTTDCSLPWWVFPTPNPKSVLRNGSLVHGTEADQGKKNLHFARVQGQTPEERIFRSGISGSYELTGVPVQKPGSSYHCTWPRGPRPVSERDGNEEGDSVFGASGCGAAGFRPRAFSILWRRFLTEFNSNPIPQRRGGFGPHSQFVSLLMVLRWKINRHMQCGTPGSLDPVQGTREASVSVSGGCLCGLGLWQNLLERGRSLRMYFILNSVGPHHAKKHFCPTQVLFLAK